MRIAVEIWLTPILSILFAALVSDKDLQSAPVEADILFEINVAGLRNWSASNALQTDQIIVQPKDDDTQRLLSTVLNAERIQGAVQLGFMSGAPTRLFCKFKFGNEDDAKQFRKLITDDSTAATGATEDLSVKPIDGLPSLFAGSVDENSVSLFSEGMGKVAKDGLVSMVDNSPWTNSEESSVKLSLNIESLRPVLNQLLVGLASSPELRDELQACFDKCDRLYASVSLEGDEVVKIVAVASEKSSTRKLRANIDGLLFLFRTNLIRFLDENSTGSESVDDAVRDLVSEISSNILEREVEVVVFRSAQTKLIFERFIEIVNSSMVRTK